LLAKKCGVWDVYAKYGAQVDPSLFNELLKITYWTDNDVAEDQRLREGEIHPTFSIDSFSSLISIIKALDGRLSSATFVHGMKDSDRRS
jgi:phosphoglycolate phosphatase